MRGPPPDVASESRAFAQPLAHQEATWCWTQVQRRVACDARAIAYDEIGSFLRPSRRGSLLARRRSGSETCQIASGRCSRNRWLIRATGAGRKSSGGGLDARAIAYDEIGSFYPPVHLGEEACSPHERSGTAPRMSPAAARSRDHWLIRATGAGRKSSGGGLDVQSRRRAVPSHAAPSLPYVAMCSALPCAAHHHVQHITMCGASS